MDLDTAATGGVLNDLMELEGGRGPRRRRTNLDLIWVVKGDRLESALLRPAGMPDEVYAIALQRLYKHLLEYRGLPERSDFTPDRAKFIDPFASMELGTDVHGAWGPGVLSGAGMFSKTVNLDKLTDAAVLDLRTRMAE